MRVKRIPAGQPFFEVSTCICPIADHDVMLLLRKRADHPLYPGLLGFPGGKMKRVDRGNPVNTACREIREETGNLVSAENLYLLGSWPFKHFRPDGEPFYFLAHCFYLKNQLLLCTEIDPREHQEVSLTKAQRILEMDPKLFVPDAHAVFAQAYDQIFSLL